MAARRWGTHLSCGAIVFGVFASLVIVPTAQADTRSYLDQIYGAGIHTPGGDPELKEWGWEICALAKRGVAPDKIRAQAVYNSQSRPPYGMTVAQADLIMHAAMTELCPGNR